ncbi:MAG: exo-alpha-sialidase [Ruminococcaceae bacterium]|nr:exo-alpha-sialidase [Oscillospiraceae bacterium]
MKNSHLFLKITVYLLVLSTILALAAGCKNDTNSEKDPSQNEEAFIDISNYAIVRRDKVDKIVVTKTANIKLAILDKLGADLPVQTDWYNPNTPPDPNAKEILVDQTNRKESQDALAKLEAKEDDAYIIEITENKIVILGKTQNSTLRAIEYFMQNYVFTSTKSNCLGAVEEKSLILDYTFGNILIAGKLDMDIDLVSTVFAVPNEHYSKILGYSSHIVKSSYPSVIELKYQPNEKDNGKLLANFHIGETPAVPNAPNSESCIMESTDGGKNWKIIARPEETIDKTLTGVTMAHLFELPAQVGVLPAGTIILSGNSVNWTGKSIVAIWCSFDCGYTWEEFSILAEGGATRYGVWEPFMWYEPSDGYLYCFYSDDSDPKYDQKLVYKRSNDGKNWWKEVNVCAFSNFEDRPGMLSLTKMGNGEYFITYEYYGGDDGYIYYKTTKDVRNWDAADKGTKIATAEGHTIGSAPWCVWTPAGGECGTLFVTGRWEENGDGTNRVFVSFDYGKTWETIENPLPFDESNDVGDYGAYGRSPCLIVGKDPSIIYYVNTTDVPETGRQRVQFAKLKINN